MFTRARLRLTLLYLALMGVTLVLVAAGILVLGARQTRQSDDLGLRLRAEGLAQPPPGNGRGHSVLQGPAPDETGAPGIVTFGRVPGVVTSGQPPPDWEEQLRLERQGIVSYILPVIEGAVINPIPEATGGLPSVEAASAALAAGEGQYRTLTVDGGQVRVYSLPASRDGDRTAVVQVVRSSYFVNETIKGLAILAGGLGALGLTLSGLAGFWLAGKTLRPIATAIERQRRFTADASHELRTPLALIRGYTELLGRHAQEPIGAYTDVVQEIVDESDRLERLVSDLLTLARADSGDLQISRDPVDLSRLATDLVQSVTPLGQAKGLTLCAEVTAGVVVAGDPDRLRQLGLILLDNAIRYTPSGVVTVHVTRDGNNAVLAVSDTGPGIPAEHLPRLFDRFYRTDDARSTEQGGTGLGLSIAEWIAEAHGGHIDVRSEPGRGSTFAVYLPRERSAAPHEREMAAFPGKTQGLLRKRG